MLLEKGADPNAQLDGQDWTAVHAAYDNPEAMRLLLAKGGDPDRVADSSTALLLAVRWDNLGTLKAVLERSPRPNLEAEDDEHMTALCRACFEGILHEAVRNCDLPVLKALVKAGADINALSGETGSSILYLIARYLSSSMTGTRETLEYFVEELGLPVNIYGGPLGWPLTAAAHRPGVAFEYLLEHGANTEVEDSIGRRPTHVAAIGLDFGPALRSLISRGASVLASDKMGLLPVHYAAHGGHPEQLKVLLDQPGVLVNAPDADGWTPLMWACTNRRFPVERINLLIAKGADIWARGDGWDHQWSPLRLARFNGLDAEVQALLQPGSAAQESEGVEPEREWDEEFHQIEEGNWLHDECFACMSDMSGKRWRCISCPAEYPVEICFKCYRYKEMIHGQHEFKEEGFEFEHERLKSLEAAGANTPFGDHGDNASGSFSDDGETEVRTTKRDRRASRSSNSDSRSDSSIGIEDEDSDEGFNEDESSGDEK
ncbi:putative ankyrin repeat protein like [Verticillium longisporum]|nr:putative ankyrin repeat protein like [Verticillium longisporum]